MKEVLSFGGGTQSSAIVALIIQGKLPKPDAIVIADTGYEKSTTWAYLDSVIQPALKEIGLEVHVVSQEWANAGLVSKNGKSILMPMFTTQVQGQVGKLGGFCSSEWKVRPMERYLKKVLGISKAQTKKWIGFSLDESRRAIRMMATDDYEKGRIRFPLIHDVPLKRHQAIREVEKMGWPTPPRSACYFCPNMADDEWRDILPEEINLASQLEKQMQETDPFVFLHKSGKPILEVDFTKPDDQPELFERACSSGVCFV
jgi:hypothetical protein